MSRYRLAAPAKEDLAEIWEFIAEQSGEARTADRAVDAVIERLVMLAQNPRAGRLREEIGPGVRSFPAGAYIVYYRLGRVGRVTIARVLHGSRDQAAAYDEAGGRDSGKESHH